MSNLAPDLNTTLRKIGKVTHGYNVRDESVSWTDWTTLHYSVIGEDRTDHTWL